MYSLLEILPLATKGVEVQPTMQNLAPKLTHLRVSIDVGPPTASYTMSTPLPRKIGFMYLYYNIVKDSSVFFGVIFRVVQNRPNCLSRLMSLAVRN